MYLKVSQIKFRKTSDISILQEHDACISHPFVIGVLF